jgi:small multidrug resistance pump
MKWIVLMLGIASSATASVLIKLAITTPRKISLFHEPMSTLYNLHLWLGLGFYGLAFLVYAIALSLFPLNVAYPILTSGSIALVAVLSALIFQEPYHWTLGVGVVLIITGVTLITSKAI